MSQDRRFHLERDEDVSGVSGTGTVATGVAFQDGTVVLHWLGTFNSTCVYSRMGDVLAIHGHGQATRVVYDDAPADHVCTCKACNRNRPSGTSEPRA